MFDFKYEAHDTLQQYKADLRAAKHRNRKRRLSEGGSPVNRGCPKIIAQDSAQDVTCDSRRASAGDVPRGRSIGREEGQRARTRVISVKADGKTEKRDGPTPIVEHAKPAVLARDFAIEISQEFMTRTEAGNTESKDNSLIRTKTVQFKPTSQQHNIDRAPTFAPNPTAKASAGRFVHHRDTFAVAKSRRSQRYQKMSTVLPLPVVKCLLRHIDHTTYLSLRLVSRTWSKAVDQAEPPHFPAIYRLPQELIQVIYSYLLVEEYPKTSHVVVSAKDFNNARHTCRSWMAASLDKRLLALAFLRAGWWNRLCVHVADFLERAETDEDDPELLWRMSLLLARECELTDSGNGDHTRGSRSG